MEFKNITKIIGPGGKEVSKITRTSDGVILWQGNRETTATKLIYGGSVGFKFGNVYKDRENIWVASYTLKPNNYKYVYVSAFINGGTATSEGFNIHFIPTNDTSKDYYVGTWSSETGSGKIYTGYSSKAIPNVSYNPALTAINAGGTFKITASFEGSGTTYCDFMTDSSTKLGVWFSETNLNNPPD